MYAFRSSISKPARLQPIPYATRLRPSHRSFHSTRPKQFIEPAIAQTHTILEALHSTTGLPWVATIPLAALAIRVAIVLPLSLVGRKSAQKRLELQPLLNAWQHQQTRHAMTELKSQHMEEKAIKSVAKGAQFQKRREIYKRWGCRWYTNLFPVLQLPVFLVVIETLRKMCGSHEGLLGLVSKPFIMASEAINSIYADRGEVLDALATSHANVPVETSFSLEGALWFPDLIASDPMLVLPFMLSGVMFANIATVSSGGAKGAARTTRQRWLTNVLKLAALGAGPATLQMPSALLIYWISSSVFALGQNVLLDKFMPLKVPVKPRKLSPSTSLMSNDKGSSPSMLTIGKSMVSNSKGFGLFYGGKR